MPKAFRKEGDVTTAKNDYKYIYVKDPEAEKLLRRPLHHVIAEQKLGRKLQPDERVLFKDNDRTNLDPDNIVCVPKNGSRAGLVRRRALLVRQIARLQEELREIDDSINN